MDNRLPVAVIEYYGGGKKHYVPFMSEEEAARYIKKTFDVNIEDQSQMSFVDGIKRSYEFENNEQTGKAIRRIEIVDRSKIDWLSMKFGVQAE